MKIEGYVKSAELCTPIKGVVINIYNKNRIINTYYSDENGHWIIDESADYCVIVFSKDGYVSKQYNELHCSNNLIRLLENNLIGYQDKLQFDKDELISVYVNSPVAYSAKLYRHGLEKKCILDCGVFNSISQNIPDGVFVDSGLEWKSSFQYKIPDNAECGLYSLILEAKGEECFAIPFILSSKNNIEKAKIVVLASTTTWQSYNIWGGRSRYRNFEESKSKDYAPEIKSYSIYKKLIVWLKKFVNIKFRLIIKKIFNKFIESSTEFSTESSTESSTEFTEWMHKKLSIKRPFTNCKLEGESVFEPFTNHLANGEWRLLAWLEKNSIDYDILSGADLHNNPEVLKGYKAIVFNTHCEYWSSTMYESVRTFHEDNCGWILNLSGNTMYRQIEFYDDDSTRCSNLFFKEGYTDETKILGVRYTSSDYSTCAPYKILEPDHWVFKNIPLTKNDCFGGLSLNQNTRKKYMRYDPGRPGVEFGLKGMGASGWETDKLSSTAPEGFKVVAKGTNINGGADMVIREPYQNRGGVFSSSSLVFNGSLLIDSVASEIIRNVFNRILEDI